MKSVPKVSERLFPVLLQFADNILEEIMLLNPQFMENCHPSCVNQGRTSFWCLTVFLTLAGCLHEMICPLSARI